MALFRNFGVNHAKDVTGLAESLVRRTKVRLRAMPLISLNLRKNIHFWIGNLFAPFIRKRTKPVPTIGYQEGRLRRSLPLRRSFRVDKLTTTPSRTLLRRSTLFLRRFLIGPLFPETGKGAVSCGSLLGEATPFSVIRIISSSSSFLSSFLY
jgi:hypothetical protein